MEMHIRIVSCNVMLEPISYAILMGFMSMHEVIENDEIILWKVRS